MLSTGILWKRFPSIASKPTEFPAIVIEDITPMDGSRVTRLQALTSLEHAKNKSLVKVDKEEGFA